MYATRSQNIKYAVRIAIVALLALIIMPLASHVLGTDGTALWWAGLVYGITGVGWATLAYHT